MTTLREKRHRRCLATIDRLVTQQDLTLNRLVRINRQLRDERKRLAYYAKPAPELKLTPLPEAPPWVKDEVLEHGPPLSTLYVDPAKEKLADNGDVDLEIPDWLWRGERRKAKDAAARAEIEAEQAERKAVKTKARIAKLKATQSGETRRMPLTGRDALKRIREG